MSAGPVTLDRQSKGWALLCLPNGDQFDVYGDDWVELVADAKALAAHLGVQIDTFNGELPE